MRSKYTFKTAVARLLTHKLRSFLTILGIVIGVMSIVLIVSIGNGAEKLILNEISGLGAETIVIRPGQEPEGPSDFGDTLFTDSLTNRDLELLKRKSNVPDLVSLTPFVIVAGSVSYEGETFRPTIFGGTGRFMTDFFNVFVESGSVFTEDDLRQRASLAMIGWKVKKELFGDSDAIGEKITIKGRKFRVAGVYPKKGQVAFMNVDEVVVIPYTTAQAYILGIDHFHEIIAKTTGPEVVDRAQRDIETTLRNSHGIDDPKKDDFFTATQQGLVEQVKTIIGALTVFLSSVVAIALVVGGIGVMNIMFVSVTERTREIGLRKALGATNRDILNQFLIEAILLTASGGIIGIAIGAILAFLTSIILTKAAGLNWAFTFPFSAALLGFFVSALVGLVFGLYPARKASQKSPIEALRYE